jgi:pSer/pThr/pTyr-binding forkhead associated (FHA) protein
MRDELENIFGIFLRDKTNQSVLSVLRHGEFTLGRALDNDLVIQNPTISNYHAKIYTYLTASYIEDLGSTNGTFIDGKRIEKHVLKPGNVIKLGDYELEVRERQPEVALS